MAEQRGALELLEVGLVLEDEVPVGDVGERGDRVAAQLRRAGSGSTIAATIIVTAISTADRGQQPPRPPQPEAAEVDVAAARGTR